MDVESTGIPELDYVTGGIPPFGLTILLGPPGSGKTVMALQIATHHALQGKDVVYFSAFSEPHEKLMAHLGSFTFFDPRLVGDRITMLSLKSAAEENSERVLETVFQALHGKQDPLLIIDGFRGLHQRVGALVAQDLLSGLSTQLAYYRARCIVTAEILSDTDERFFELSPGDALIALYSKREGARLSRSCEVLKMRGHAYREGMHGLEIGDSGIAIYPRLATALPETTPLSPPVRRTFDLPAFDAMLGGGLPTFSTTVLVGDVGTGRTTFALQYLLAGARIGDRGLMVSLDNAAVDLLQKAEDLGLDLASPVERGEILLLEVPPVEVDPYRLAWTIRQLVQEHGVSRLVIDSVTSLESIPSVQRSQRDYLSAVNLYLRRAGVTTVMTQGTPRFGVALPPGGAVRMPAADNRILLRRVAFAGRLHRVCLVLNMHYSDHDTGIHAFTIGEGGIRILEAGDLESQMLAAIERDLPVSFP